ncbi:hypothetical protein CCR75_005808 [Bremia lactucae]|uniref:Uncharacterized protein n=1 Tax=Bremia lactucae TaxID=4779 RepID=A0A976IFH7_BRELC|nr:hypothetical protein CCR75_005808 [Bremia lactucae]
MNRITNSTSGSDLRAFTSRPSTKSNICLMATDPLFKQVAVEMATHLTSAGMAYIAAARISE